MSRVVIYYIITLDIVLLPQFHRILMKERADERKYTFYQHFITFRVRNSPGEMYIDHGRLCVCVPVCLSVPRRIPALLHGAGCNLWEW